MTLNSKEHIDIMAQFERDVKRCHVHSLRFDREDKSLWAQGNVYQHGPTNELFQVFRMGYAYARCVYMGA